MPSRMRSKRCECPPGGRRRARHLLPRKRHRRRRRPRRPGRGCTDDEGRGRRADATHRSRCDRGCATTGPAHRCRRRQRFRGPHRPAISPCLHNSRRHGRARRATDGESGRQRDLDDSGRGRALEDDVRNNVRGVPAAERQSSAGRGRRYRRCCRTRVSEPRKKLPLVDRQREMPVLDAALIPVRMGFGSFVELIGDAGIGKSRIVEELCDRAKGLAVVSAACEPYEATTPYFVFRKLLGGLLDVNGDGDPAANSEALSDCIAQIDPELVPWMPLVADVLDMSVLSTKQTDELQPSFRRARLNGVIEAMLAALLNPPTLLLFEDAHWMDEASCDLLRHIGTHVATKPWLVCSTRRPVGGGFVAAEGTPPVPASRLGSIRSPKRTRRSSPPRPPRMISRPSSSTPSLSGPAVTRSSCRSSSPPCGATTTTWTHSQRARRRCDEPHRQLAPAIARSYAGRQCSAELLRGAHSAGARR